MLQNKIHERGPSETLRKIYLPACWIVVFLLLAVMGGALCFPSKDTCQEIWNVHLNSSTIVETLESNVVKYNIVWIYQDQTFEEKLCHERKTFYYQIQDAEVHVNDEVVVGTNSSVFFMPNAGLINNCQAKSEHDIKLAKAQCREWRQEASNRFLVGIILLGLAVLVLFVLWMTTKVNRVNCSLFCVWLKRDRQTLNDVPITSSS